MADIQEIINTLDEWFMHYCPDTKVIQKFQDKLEELEQALSKTQDNRCTCEGCQEMRATKKEAKGE